MPPEYTFLRMGPTCVPIAFGCPKGRCIGAPSSLSVTPNTLLFSLCAIPHVVPGGAPPQVQALHPSLSAARDR